MSNINTINTTDVEAKIKWHLDEANKLQNALNVLLASFGKQIKSAPVNVENKPVNPVLSKLNFAQFKAVTPVTFKSTIIDIFNQEQKPLTAKDVLDIYTHKTNKEIKYSNFSGQFSGLSTRDTVLKKITFPNNPIETKYYYGLSDWFIENNIKDVYMEKIKAG